MKLEAPPDLDARDWTRRVLGIGKPLMLGLLVFAAIGAAVAWGAVNLLWIGAVAWRRRRRQRVPQNSVAGG